MARADVARAPDASIIYALTFVYLVALVLALPPLELPRAVGSAALLAATLHLLGSRLRGKPMTGIGTLIVGFVALGVLVFPTFGAFGGAGGIVSLGGLLGAQVCLLIWCSARWGVRPPFREQAALREVLMMAGLLALVVSLVATVPIVRGLLGGAGLKLLAVYPAYVVGAAGAAVTYWSLQRFRHLATGRFAIGLLGGICVYGAVSPIVFLWKAEPFDPVMGLVIALVAGGLVGPALMFDSELADAT